ncbi:hypothetical protein EMCLV016R [Equine molluscum contagiosum-like virus]|nr:hypothetical protein EMCLV016R [Equine molluscum contagiosum-like virus]
MLGGAHPTAGRKPTEKGAVYVHRDLRRGPGPAAEGDDNALRLSADSVCAGLGLKTLLAGARACRAGPRRAVPLTVVNHNRVDGRWRRAEAAAVAAAVAAGAERLEHLRRHRLCAQREALRVDLFCAGGVVTACDDTLHAPLGTLLLLFGRARRAGPGHLVVAVGRRRDLRLKTFFRTHASRARDNLWEPPRSAC